MHSVKSVVEQVRNAVVYPDLKGDIIVVLSLEQLLLVAKSNRTKNYLVIDSLSQLVNSRIPLLGVSTFSTGKLVRSPLVVPKVWVETKLDFHLHVLKAVLHRAKNYASTRV